MTDRDPLGSIHRRQRRDIDLLYATLAVAVSNAVADMPGDQLLTSLHRDAILREVDAGLNVIWGRYPGDPDAAIHQVVVRDTGAARLGPLDAAVQDWRRAMDKDLLALIDEEAGWS